jgi:hypothetical protein
MAVAAIKKNQTMSANPIIKLVHSSLLLTAGLMLLMTACSSTPKPQPLKLSIQADGQAARLTIRVYVGAANQYDKTLVDSKVDDLLQQFSASVPSEIFCFQLTSRGQDVPLDDPMWRVWRDQKRADQIVVIADLPKNFGGSEPERRRVVVPLDKKLWHNLQEHTVHLRIREDKVELLDNPGY